MRFEIAVILPPDTKQITEEVARLMEPYNAALEVPPHKELVPDYEIERIVSTYGLARDDLEAIAAEIQAESGFESGVEDNRVYWEPTYNPREQWDGWILHSLADDVWPTSAFPADHTPAAVITPDGVWHELGYKSNMSDTEQDTFRRRIRALLGQFPSHRVVALDVHR